MKYYFTTQDLSDFVIKYGFCIGDNLLIFIDPTVI